MDLFDRPRAQRKGDKPQADTTIEGTVERVVYSGGDGEFTVARLKVEGRGSRGHRRRQPGRHPGGRRAARAAASSRPTARFGEQFRVDRYTEVAPQTIEGLRRYLGSGLIKGIGPEFAARIVERFGIETLEILDRDPDAHQRGARHRPGRARARSARPGARSARSAR